MSPRVKGYSVLELIIVVAIMAVLATLVIVYSNRGFNTDLNVATTGVSQALRTAREKTLASVDDTTWQVVMIGQTYAVECNKESSCASEQTYTLPAGVEFVDEYTVEFERLTGATTTATIVLTQTNGANETKEIYVSATGAIGNESVSSVGVVPSDLGARHIYIANGPMLSVGDEIALTFSGAGSGSVELPLEDTVDDYFVYSGPVETGNGSAQFDMVAKVGASPYEYHIYIDETEFAGVGVDVSLDGFSLVDLDTDGVIRSDYTYVAY